MKVLTIVVYTCLLAVIVSCVVGIYFNIKDHENYSTTITHHGHSYVLVHANGENAMTHDPDCGCLADTITIKPKKDE